MRVYIVRHGEAEEAATDDARKLTETGRSEAALVGRGLRSAASEWGAIWHSDKTRARETAEIVARESGALVMPSAQPGLRPNDPVDPMAVRLEALDHDVCIVSHLPFVGLLCDTLLTRGRASVPWTFDTGATACLERAGAGAWQLLWFLPPASPGASPG